MNKIGYLTKSFWNFTAAPGPEICRKFNAARLKINTLLKFCCKSTCPITQKRQINDFWID